MENKFGDTSIGIFLGDVINNCLREESGGKSVVDMNLLISMCKAEPKSAQVTMQILAQDLKAELKGNSVSKATGISQTNRLLIGSLFGAYSIAREYVKEVPPEMVQLVKMNPIIKECFEFVIGDQKRFGNFH